MAGGVDAVSAQLQLSLRESIAGALATGRPTLTHLNADTTWLLSLTYPPNAKSSLGRTRFNILIDPWLQGPQSDVAGWFSTQWHAIKSSVQTITDLNGLLAELEGAETTINASEKRDHVLSYVDAVICSHEFTDHCHRATLLEIDKSVPVFATRKAAELIRSWRHFETVLETPPFATDQNWTTTSLSPLPPWVGISRLVTESDALYYHSAIVICIEDVSAPGCAEAVIYTPHGVHFNTFSIILSAKPPVRALALLHGLHDVSITLTKQLNLGAHNALRAQRLLQAKYWVGTHDEVKKGGGIIAPFLRRKAHTLHDALSKEMPVKYHEYSSGDSAKATDVRYVDVCNGETLLLE